MTLRATRISTTGTLAVTFPRPGAPVPETEVADAGFLLIHAASSRRLQSYRATRTGPKQDSSRECNYVCAMRYALVLEMH